MFSHTNNNNLIISSPQVQKPQRLHLRTDQSQTTQTRQPQPPRMLAISYQKFLKRKLPMKQFSWARQFSKGQFQLCHVSIAAI